MLRIFAPTLRGGSTSSGLSLRTVALSTAFAVPVLVGVTAGFGILSAPPKRSADVETTGSLAKPEPVMDAKLLDPTPMLAGSAGRSFSAAPLASGLLPVRAASVPAQPKVEPAAARPAPSNAAPASEALRSSQAPQIIPLPVPRPPEFGAAAPVTPDVARAPARAPRRTKAARLAPPPADERSWFEKLFDINSPTPPGVSYAALDSRPVEVAPRTTRLSPSPVPVPGPEAGVAVYDITARTVTLPSGERLEAHSGLRDKMDDPRFVHVRMQGATPPGTYDLTEREALFHGVRAIRLNPVGGSAAIHDRAGILAHSYLLGPNGDSNGCVSFKDYDRFLQAYLRGEIRRLVVVAGNGQDRLPTTAMRRQGRPDLRDRDA
jgi:hypothetical protein